MEVVEVSAFLYALKVTGCDGVKCDVDEAMNCYGHGHRHGRPHAVHTTRSILSSVFYILALTSLQ